MGNIINTFKKFFTNKNTVTIFGIIAGVVVLWVFYNMRVNQAISPQKVPIATRDILSREEITKDDFEFIEVNSALLKKASVITSANLLTGRFVNIGTSIPKGGMFYTSQVVEDKDMPDSIFDSIPDKYTLYQLKVDNATTFANSIYPGNRIDLYLEIKEGSELGFGKLVESIEVLAVRDAQGQDVFDSSSTRTPAWLLFAVPSDPHSEVGDLHGLLLGIEKISGMSVRPVPRNRKYTAEAGATSIANEELRDLVEARIKLYYSE